MIFETRTAPMHYVDNIPAYKAGEWEGLKSCKFRGTRKMIRPITEGIIFNIDEPTIEPRRNRTKGPTSSEMVFKPCIKMVNYESDRKAKNESIRILVQDHEKKKPRPEKLHYFKYKEEYISNVKKKEQEIDNNEKIKEEMRLMNKIGFTDKRILPNASLLNLASKKEKKSIEETSAYWKKKEMDRINAIRDENEQISRDRDYVKTLNNWDGKFLPKINK